MKLQAVIKYTKLFVVGDLKQSIYRFRGATISAFDLIRTDETKWEEFSLNINYRTDKRLLDEFDAVFSKMGIKGYLPFQKGKDSLTSDIDTYIQTQDLITKLEYESDEERMELLFAEIGRQKDIIRFLSKNHKLSTKDMMIAILVRDNWQIHNILEEAKIRGEVIETQVGGDLYQLMPALDLYKLVLALLNPRDPISLYNLIDSNYIGIKLDIQGLHGISVQEQVLKLSDVLNHFFETTMSRKWEQIISDIKVQPLLMLLRNIYEGFERQKRSTKNALVILPADRETQGILEAFLAYVTLGNGSWNFDNSAMMVYRVQIWIEKWKKIIIDAVNSFEKQQIDYQDCALATEMIREIMQGVFTGTKVEGIPITNLMAKNLKNNSQNAHCPEWNSLVSMLLNNDEKVKDVITQYYNIIQGNLKSSQVFIRATEFNTDVRKIQKAKLLIPGEQLMLNDPIPQRREIREIYEKIYTRIPKVAEAEINKANKLLEQISMFIDYEDIDDEDIEDLVDKIKDFYETASNSLVNVHGNLSVLDGIKKDAKTIAVAFGEVEKGIDCKDALDTLLMFSKDPLSKLERLLLTLQVVQKDVEYVTRDVAKRKDNIFVDNGGDLSARYEESRSKIEEDCKLVADWKVM